MITQLLNSQMRPLLSKVNLNYNKKRDKNKSSLNIDVGTKIWESNMIISY